MTDKERLKELEEIADKLGIGQNRKVKCVSCKKVIFFRNAILLTNKEKVSHLCKECNKKLTSGELTKKEIANDEILKEIEKLKRSGTGDITPVPYIPNFPTNPYPMGIPDQTIPWKPVREPYTIGDITYTNYSYSATNGTGESILKLEPNKYDRTSY